MRFRRRRISVLLVLLAAGCAVPYAVREAAQRNRDYYLPFEAGTHHRCIQTGPGGYSHVGRDEYAVDFKMPEGTPILAARGGRVVKVKEDSDQGGGSKDYANFANVVLIDHVDGTRAVYMHFSRDSVSVEVGDEVGQGELIGLSGNTGWSTTPHLHFEVDALEPTSRRWRSIPFAFLDVPGDGVPTLYRSYVSQNRPEGGPPTRER